MQYKFCKQISPFVGPEHPLDAGDGEVPEVHLELVDGVISVELAGLPLEVGEVRFRVSVVQVLVFLVNLLSTLVLSRYLNRKTLTLKYNHGEKM